MSSAKPPSTNGTGEDKRRNNPKSSEERFQMEVVEDETGEDRPLGKSADVSGKSSGNGNGVVNRAFEDDDNNKKKKGEAKALNGGGAGGDRALHAAQQQQQQQQQQRHHTGVSNGTNGDVEMIPLTTSSVTPTNTPTPPGDRKKAVNGQQKNASASPASSQQKSSENSLKNNASNDLYTDYFMPVNNRRKLLRGQKLYVTRDQRANKRGWKWIAFWGGVCTFVAAALLTGILAATGIIMSKEEPSFSGAQSLQSNETEKASGNSTKTEDEFGGRGVILPMDPFFRQSTENLSTESPSTTTQFSPTSTITNTLEGELRLVGLDFNADFTDITSPASQELARKIESELVKTFATMNILKAKVEQFSHGSVIVHFLLTWPDHVLLVTPEQATTYFNDHLSINGDNLGDYRLDPSYFNLKELSNRCEEHNGGCSEICHWSSNDLKFMCTCNDGRMLDTDGKSCVPQVLQSHPTAVDHMYHTDDHTSSYERTVTVTATTPRSTSASRGRQLIFGVDNDDMTTNDTFISANESVIATTAEPIHDAEPEPPETTPTIEVTDTTDTYNTHSAFGLDVLNTSTSVTWEDTQHNDTAAFATTSTSSMHEIGLQIPVINDTTLGSEPSEDEDYSNFTNVQNITDPTISFTITTMSSHEMEEDVNFTSTKDDHYLHFGLNVSHATDADTRNDSFAISTTSEPYSFDNVTTPVNYTDIATVSHVSRSDDFNVSSEQPFSTLHTENDNNSTLTMMVTKSESEETVSLSNHSTSHGWDRFSHMLTTLNEATASDTQTSNSPFTAVTESSPAVLNSTFESPTPDDDNHTEISIPQSTFDNVTSDFNIEDMARMLPGFGEESKHANTESTPSSLSEPMAAQENQTEPTSMVTLSNITSGDTDTEDLTYNVTTPWTAVSYRHLYQNNNTEQDGSIIPTATEFVNLNSTVELTTQNSSISQTLRHLIIANVTATEEPLSTLSAEKDTAQSSSTHNETVTSLLTNSTDDYLTGFSNHETSQATNLTTEASDTEE